jgi:ribulose bisphosphate carboxylase small subunit
MAMSDQQRRYMHARNDFKRFHVDKAQELIDAADAVFDAAEIRVKQTEQVMEQLRPVWAHGWSSDSEAAQASANALSEIWAELGVKNQTEAMETLRDLRERASD